MYIHVYLSLYIYIYIHMYDNVLCGGRHLQQDLPGDADALHHPRGATCVLYKFLSTHMIMCTFYIAHQLHGLCLRCVDARNRIAQ